MCKQKILTDGSILLETTEGMYFQQPFGVSFPLLITKEEGDALWEE